MKDDYLWDASGEPDPEIQRLETVLGRFRHNRPAPTFDGMPTGQLSRPRSWHRNWFPRLAIGAAASFLVITAVAFVFRRPNPTHPLQPGWDVSLVEGTPRIGPQAIAASGRLGRLGIGQTLETDGRSRARIRVEEIGQVEVEPDTRLRLLKTGAGHKRLALDRGTIHATIWAPPGEFVVDTPSAVAVDLGCAYTLYVDDSGKGLLRTTLGWVGFKLEDHEAFIPAGAACATRPKIGPGTPYFEDTSESFREALSHLDFEGGSPKQRSDALAIVLAQARQRDALTLWHLLSRTIGSERSRVYNRMTALVPSPPGVTREGTLRLDPGMLDLWWDQLGLGDASVWRTWERSWSERERDRK
jgi:FecR-like protein